MGSFKDLIVYKKAFDQAMEIFVVTKSFPQDEKYSLIDQIRKSSRSFVHVWLKAIEREGIKLILFQR